jgi:hypothetical protein
LTPKSGSAAKERQSKIDAMIDAEKQKHIAHERMRNEQLREAAGIFAATRTPEEKAREELSRAEAAFRRAISTAIRWPGVVRCSLATMRRLLPKW